jgi:hypothetical protein
MATGLLHAGLYGVALGTRVETGRHLTVLLSPFPATTVTNREPNYSFLGTYLISTKSSNPTNSNSLR